MKESIVISTRASEQVFLQRRPTMTANERRRRILEEAWIGDAVLCLYCRDRILKRDGTVDGDKLTRMPSNQFLSMCGEPSHVEAEIGRV